MARGIPFPQANLTLGAPTPEDEAAGTVYGLPVHRFRDLDGNWQLVSKWELDEAERAEVARTGVVWFTCWGTTHAPMCILGHDPHPRSMEDSGNE